MSTIKFDTTKNLIVNCSEIIGLEDTLGTFTFKRLNLKERVLVDVNKTALTQGKELDNLFESIAFCVSLLELCVIKKPESVVIDELEVESLFALYDKYNEWVETFRTKFRKSQENISEAGK